MPPVKIRSRPEAKGDPAGPLALFEEYLRAHNLRMTPERRVVLETLLDHRGHFRAEEILRLVRKRSRHLSRATLYRTLEHLRCAGLVRTLQFGRNPALFETTYGREQHDHMLCEKCGAVIEFENKEFERLQNRICERHGFLPTGHVIQIFGICDACRRRQKQETRSR